MRFRKLWKWILYLWGGPNPRDVPKLIVESPVLTETVQEIVPIANQYNVDEFDKFFVAHVKEQEEHIRKVREEQEKRRLAEAQELANKRLIPLDQKFFKQAMKVLASKVLTSNGDILLSACDANINDNNIWKIFTEQFSKVITQKGIKLNKSAMSTHPQHIWVNSDSLKEYYRRCEKQMEERPEMFTTGPYR